MGKQFQDLDLSNSFLFAAAMEDSETCRLMMEMILDIPIAKVSVRVERTMLFSSECRSIRLDVYASDETGAEYNIEMQNQDEHNLAKRSRFHQSEMDAMSLRPGEGFEQLQPGYVVFICSFDPFGRGLYRYTFENRCLEQDFPLDDGTRKIFLNAKGTNADEVSEGLVHFLHYVVDSRGAYVETADDGRLRKIHDRVMAVKKNRTWEERYMTVDELIRSAERRVKRETEEQAFQLAARMVEAGEADKIPRLQQDSEFLQQMLEKYHL